MNSSLPCTLEPVEWRGDPWFKNLKGNVVQGKIRRTLLILFGILFILFVSNPSLPFAQKKSEKKQPKAPQKIISIINRGGCANCHTIPGVPGADGDIGPDLSKLGVIAGKRRKGYSAKKYIRESIKNPNAFIVPGEFFGPGIMPQQFAKTLSKGELDLLVDYLASLGVKSPKVGKQPRPKLDFTRPSETQRKPFTKPKSKAPTDAQVILGRYLFYDKRLSANNSLSCSSCHQPDKHFTDGRKTSRGFPGTKLFRNTPTLWNASFAKSFYWDGRLSGSDMPTLVRDHLTVSFLMAADGRLLIERMKQVPEYVDLFEKAFNSEPSFGGILNAVAAYVKTLNTPMTRFDRYLEGEEKALEAEEKAGWALFKGKAGCIRCHPSPFLTDHKFHDLGLSSNSKWWDDPEQQVTFRRFFRGLGVPNYRNLRVDVGRFPMRLEEKDKGKFRTPGLREVGNTAPYGHDGRFATLEEVVEFYNQGGGEDQRANLKPLGLSKQEKSHLVAFLRSLSAPQVKIETPVLPDYVVLPPRKPNLKWPPKVAAKKIETPRPLPITPLPDPPAPPDNLTTPVKVALGRLLFFDTRMSADSAVSCNTCHPANTGYAARSPISMGGTGTSHWRNASTLFNVAYYHQYNWDGARGSIEKQNAGAWGGAVAGNVDSDLAEERLYQIPEYRKRFKNVFGQKVPTWGNALRAVAAFQRSLVSKNVPFDTYLLGKKNAISKSAERGFKLFTGKAKCSACHHSPLLSDHRFHNLGLPPSPGFSNSPLRQITFRYEQAAKGVPRKVYEKAADDLGLYYVTKRPEDVGKFRTPSLRELKHTAPYMHNGVLKTLEEVVAFYNKGGGEDPRKSPLLKPLNLTKSEQQDLIAFLESLSGDPQVIQPPDPPPYGLIPPKGGK